MVGGGVPRRPRQAEVGARVGLVSPSHHRQSARGPAEKQFSDLPGETGIVLALGLYTHGSTGYGGQTQETKDVNMRLITCTEVPSAVNSGPSLNIQLPRWTQKRRCAGRVTRCHFRKQKETPPVRACPFRPGRGGWRKLRKYILNAGYTGIAEDERRGKP